MGGWGCPHEVNRLCQQVEGVACQPGMKGCVLFARMRETRQHVNKASQPSPPDNAIRQTPRHRSQ